MRFLLLMVIVFGSLPLIVIQPFVGLLVYAWLAYFRPHTMTWGSAPQLSLWVALAMLVGMVLATGRERWLSLRPITLLLVALGMWVGVSGLLAVSPIAAREWTIQIEKLLLIAVLTTGLVRTHTRFRLLYLVVALSLGLLGFKLGLYSVMRGGVRIGQSQTHGDNNGLALILCMGLPLLVGVALTEKSRWLRTGAAVLAVFSVAAILSTFSRGGLIALSVVAVILLARSGKPVMTAIVGALALVGILTTTTEGFQQSYLERASSISEFQEDSSVTGRFREWGTAVKVVADYPITGVGPDNLSLVRPFYVFDGSRFKTTHNTYLQVLVACGIPGFLLFGAAIGLGVWRLEVLRKRTANRQLRTYGSMMQTSLIAYLVGATALDAAYLELVYQLVAMVVSLELVIEAESEQAPVVGITESADASAWWREAPARSGLPS